MMAFQSAWHKNTTFFVIPIFSAECDSCNVGGRNENAIVHLKLTLLMAHSYMRTVFLCV